MRLGPYEPLFVPRVPLFLSSLNILPICIWMDIQKIFHEVSKENKILLS